MLDISILTMVYKPTYNWGGTTLKYDVSLGCQDFVSQQIGTAFINLTMGPKGQLRL